MEHRNVGKVRLWEEPKEECKKKQYISILSHHPVKMYKESYQDSCDKIEEQEIVKGQEGRIDEPEMLQKSSAQ